jgi:hypothetical protein
LFKRLPVRLTVCSAFRGVIGDSFPERAIAPAGYLGMWGQDAREPSRQTMERTMRNLTMCAALLGTFAIVGASAMPASAAPFSNSAAVKSAVETNVTDVQSRRGWSARNKSYFRRDCMGDYDSSGVKC